MKRLLTYLFIVLGLGLVVSVSANAVEKSNPFCVFINQDGDTHIIFPYGPGDRVGDNCYEYDGWVIDRAHKKFVIMNKFYQSAINSNSSKKYGHAISVDKKTYDSIWSTATAIKKKEPSQTQEVAQKSLKPDFSNYDYWIQKSIEDKCKVTKIVDGPTAYINCANDELLLLSKISSMPDVSGYDYWIQKSLEDKCKLGNIMKGPTVYINCANDELLRLSKISSIPDLSAYENWIRESMESKCKLENIMKGPVALINCINLEIAKLNKKEPSQTQEVAKKKEIKEESNERKDMVNKIERLRPEDYYLFAHSTTGEKFWGSTTAKSKKLQVGTATSSNGYTCELISKQLTNKAPYKGSFKLKCPSKVIKGSWTQECDYCNGLGEAFTTSGDVITAFFSRKQSQIVISVNNYFVSSKTQIAKTDEQEQEEIKIKTKKLDTTGPEIEIAEAITVDDSSYSLKGKVSDKGSDKIYIKVDGQDIPVKKGKFKINRYSPVDEEVKIVAIDQWGNKSTKVVKVTIDIKEETIVQKLEPLDPSKIITKSSNSKVALIIGIENYLETPNANYANLDAKYFFDYAIKGFGVKKQNIKLLIDEEATFVKTNKALTKWLRSKVKSNQSDLIIFFAGHGLASIDGQELYLLPQDSDPDLLARTALSRTELFKEIISLNPKSVTMFLDTCYSGVSRDEQMLLASARPIRIVADEQEGIPDNFTIFSASKLDQISSGLKEAKHGIFSYYLMKGLEGKADSNKDKQITNGELLAYMDINVSQKAAELGRQQNPSLTGDPDKVLMSYR